MNRWARALVNLLVRAASPGVEFAGATNPAGDPPGKIFGGGGFGPALRGSVFGAIPSDSSNACTGNTLTGQRVRRRGFRATRRPVVFGGQRRDNPRMAIPMKYARIERERRFLLACLPDEVDPLELSRRRRPLHRGVAAAMCGGHRARRIFRRLSCGSGARYDAGAGSFAVTQRSSG
jgi:hypothetical protein